MSANYFFRSLSIQLSQDHFFIDNVIVGVGDGKTIELVHALKGWRSRRRREPWT